MFINYTTTNSGIGSNSLRCISVDRYGDKWIGRTLNYAVKYDSKNNIWVEYNSNWPGITGGSVLAILNDSRNIKWFGTYDALFSYNDTIVISHSPPLIQGIFGNFVEDKFGNNWFWRLDDDQAHVAQTTVTKTILDNNWHMLTLVVDRTNQKAYSYTDGVLSTTPNNISSLIGDISPPNNLFLGGTSYFNGQIDDVRIYNYALTAEQIKTVYNNGAVNFQ